MVLVYDYGPERCSVDPSHHQQSMGDDGFWEEQLPIRRQSRRRCFIDGAVSHHGEHGKDRDQQIAQRTAASSRRPA
jgi:hypothetical protein